MRLVECVPNFSEGRDRAVIDAIAAAIAGVDGATLLDVDPGAGANRTVVTFVGAPESVLEAGFRAIRTAAQRIDMRRHHGEHPRMGATDVFPFVPVTGVTMDDCVQLARELGRRVAAELGIPVYLYEAAAAKPERRSLAGVRAGEYEGLRAKLADAAWAPDFGKPVFNERSGATAIGARKFLVAYNVNLNTTARKPATRIARQIREQGRPIRAIGWTIPEYRRAQVSMNLMDLDEAGIHHAFDEVVRLADAAGLRVTGSEIVGLVPEEALLAAGRHYLQRQGKSPGAPADELIENAVQTLGLRDVGTFDADQRIIERRLLRKERLTALTVEQWLTRLGSSSPTPGGGSAAALAAACAGSLAAMVAGITYERLGGEASREELGAVALRAQAVQRAARAGIDADAAAYDGVVAALRLPKGSAEEQQAREQAMSAASRQAAQVPFELLRGVESLLDGLETLARRGHPACASDVVGAATLAASAAETAYANVIANLPSAGDRRWAARMAVRAEALRRRIDGRAAAIASRSRRALTSALGPRRGKGTK